MNILLHIDEVKTLLATSDDVIIVNVSKTPVKGAVTLSGQNDLSGTGTFMPKVEKIVSTLGEKGITEKMKVIIVDDGNNRLASKCWVVFDYLGHEQVSILRGGVGALEAADIMIEEKVRRQVTYEADLRPEVIVTIDKVKTEMDNEQSTLIDSRAYQRYLGEVEPKYKKAGHIPGAKNFFSGDIFTEAGTFKTEAALATHFSPLKNQEEVIVSCGSGASACMNVVALKAAGFTDVKLYPGGFSEWIADDDNEVAQGE